jgi:hypothetical protein
MQSEPGDLRVMVGYLKRFVIPAERQDEISLMFFVEPAIQCKSAGEMASGREETRIRRKLALTISRAAANRHHHWKEAARYVCSAARLRE